MDSAQWDKIQRLFNQAVELGPTDRHEFLRDLKTTDEGLYQELQTLLRADRHDDRFTEDLGLPFAATTSSANFEGRTVGPYLIEEKIGQGAMSVVYKATDTRLDRHVALKFLSGSHAATHTARMRFFAEAKAVSRLDHPNISTIFDIGETAEGELYVAIAYYDGMTLAERLTTSPMPLAAAVDWVRQIADGLRHAHRKGVIHRDIKAANIFLADSEQVKILDFGIAKLEGLDFTDPGLRLGTVAYMPPEQLLGSTVDRRCDIWALGVVAYELLTGTRPFRGDTSGQIADQVLTADIVPITDKIDWLPAIVDRINARCLARDMDARYQDIDQLLADLGILRNLLEVDARLAAYLVGRANATGRYTADITQLSEIEARQLTVVSCTFNITDADDPPADHEHAAELAMRLQRHCESYALAESIAYVQSVDSLITLVFGYPQSVEDNSLRALRAAVALRDQLLSVLGAEFGAPHRPYGIRIGVHTGDAIVDRTAPTNTGAIKRLQGDVHIAAKRIQKFAAAGDIVVSQTTANLLPGQVELEPVGRLPAAGARPAIAVHRAIGYSEQAATRRRRLRGAAHALVGRSSERAMLRESWQSVVEGEGKVVVIKGEAGIGKSRLIELAANESIGLAAASTLRLYCSPYHQHSFLYPVKEWLRGELAESESDPEAGVSIDRLASLLRPYRLNDQRSLALFAQLLDIEVGDRQHPQEMALTTPEMRRHLTLQAILDLIARRSQSAPLLTIVEDLHWADASSLELIHRLVDQGPLARRLLIMSFRPQFTAEWLGRAHVLQLTLGKLSRSQSEALARDRFGSLDVPADLVAKIAQKSDGVPLFVEELVSTLRATITARRQSDAADFESRIHELTVPETLKDSLAARLDQHLEYKSIAQLAAVLGREFDYQTISKIWTGQPQVLNAGLRKLVESELLFQSGTIPEANFVFKHALIRDTAYNSLLRDARKTLHLRVARVLESAFPDSAQRHPELLAQHYSHADRLQDAIAYWARAGRLAAESSANVEAVAHLTAGLDLLRTLPPTPQRKHQELELELLRSGALRATKGIAAREAGDCYRRVRELCQELGETAQLFPTLNGLYAYHLVRSDHSQALDTARQLLALSQQQMDGALDMIGHRAVGAVLLHMGRLQSACRHLEQALTLYDPSVHESLAPVYGTDHAAITSSFLGIAYWLLGYPNQALAIQQRALQHAREMGHAHSVAQVLTHLNLVRLLRRDHDVARDAAEQLLQFSEQHSFPFMAITAQFWMQWAKLAQTPSPQGIERLRQAAEAWWSEAGAGIYRPLFFTVLAEFQGRMGAARAGLELLDEAQAWMQRSGECWAEAELYRVRGTLSVDDVGAAESCLEQALTVARRQGAKMWELRAAVSLAELWRGQGRLAEARDLLALLRDGFDDAEDSAEVMAAEALLEDMALH